MTEIFLIVVTFIASTTAAMVGIGGGILLISVMPGLIPPFAIIPVHGMVQVASNFTRVLFGIRHVVWSVFLPFFIGAVLGAAVGSQILVDIQWDYLPLIMGVFILIITWTPSFKHAPDVPGKYGILGALQTFLSLFVGVVGPLNMPFLVREGFSRDRVVVTHAIQMTALHTIKVATFAALGFTFAPYVYLIAGMILSATLGSYAGTHWRSRVPEDLFRRILKWIITALAVRMILRAGL